MQKAFNQQRGDEFFQGVEAFFFPVTFLALEKKKKGSNGEEWAKQ